jgi:hypothetical protein
VLKRWFGHAVQDVAPLDPNESVTHPASHETHAIVEFALYLLAGQLVHVVALGAASVLVTLPG